MNKRKTQMAVLVIVMLIAIFDLLGQSSADRPVMYAGVNLIPKEATAGISISVFQSGDTSLCYSGRCRYAYREQGSFVAPALYLPPILRQHYDETAGQWILSPNGDYSIPDYRSRQTVYYRSATGDTLTGVRPPAGGYAQNVDTTGGRLVWRFDADEIEYDPEGHTIRHTIHYGPESWAMVYRDVLASRSKDGYIDVSVAHKQWYSLSPGTGFVIHYIGNQVARTFIPNSKP